MTREEFQTKLSEVIDAQPAFNDGALYFYDSLQSIAVETVEDYIAREFSNESDAEYVAEFRKGLEFALETLNQPVGDADNNDGIADEEERITLHESDWTDVPAEDLILA